MSAKKCCIYGEKFTGWGNNPAPVKTRGECCDACNSSVVVPARLAQFFGSKSTTEKKTR